MLFPDGLELLYNNNDKTMAIGDSFKHIRKCMRHDPNKIEKKNNFFHFISSIL